VCQVSKDINEGSRCPALLLLVSAGRNVSRSKGGEGRKKRVRGRLPFGSEKRSFMLSGQVLPKNFEGPKPER